MQQNRPTLGLPYLLFWQAFCEIKPLKPTFHWRNRSALAVNCCALIHCLEVSCKEDQITSAHSKQWKHIWSLQLDPAFHHCNEELPPILKLRPICLCVFVMSFKGKNGVTPSNAMNDVIFQQQMMSASINFPCTFKTVNYSLIYQTFLALTV